MGATSLGYSPKQLPFKERPADVFAVSADGKIVVGLNGRDVLLFRVSDWTMLTQFRIPPTPKHPDHPASVAISPSVDQFAVGTGFGYVHVYRMGDTAPLHSFVAYQGDDFRDCEAVAFSPDGQLLATGRGLVSVTEVDDGWTRLWRTSDWGELARLIGGVGSVRSMAWNPSGTRLAAGDDRSLRIWRTTSLPPQLETVERTTSVNFSVAFSAKGMLAVANGDTVRIYE